MDRLTPTATCFKPGRSRVNPMAMAAGIATLRLLSDERFLHLERLAQRLCAGMGDVFRRREVPHTLGAAGSMFRILLRRRAGDGSRRREDLRRRALRAVLSRHARSRLLLRPSQFEAGFVSLAHTTAEIDATIAGADAAMAEVHACR